MGAKIIKEEKNRKNEKQVFFCTIQLDAGEFNKEISRLSLIV